MNTRNIWIIVLSVSATLLLAVNVLLRTPALAAEVVRDPQYQAITARNQTGGEALYIVDNKTGLMAVFTWDSSSRTIVPRDVRAVADAFRQ